MRQDHGAIVKVDDRGDHAVITYKDGTIGFREQHICQKCGNRVMYDQDGFWQGPGLGVIHLDERPTA